MTSSPVAGAYENEFALAASAEVVAVVTLGLMLTIIMPGVPWAVVAATPGPGNHTTVNVTETPLPIVNEVVSLWDNSCGSAAMSYTFSASNCVSAFTAIAAFAVLATLFQLLAVLFGIMPFSTVAPRQPKVALTHAMLSQMMASVFALLTWSIFYGALVFRVWRVPNEQVVLWGSWSSSVLVTSGGICAVAAWVSSFTAWVLSLSAMIKYDTSAAEQAIVDHQLRKEENAKRRRDLVARLGEGAARAAREGIALELGDKLYLGGAISAGAVSGVAWADMGLAQYLLADPRAVPKVAGAFTIINVVASVTGATVLLLGLTDLISRVKAAVGGFAVMAVVCAIWLVDFSMAVLYLQTSQSWLASYEITLGTVGIVFSLGTTGVLYHPMKIWDKMLSEIPRPAKMFHGFSGKALAITASVFSLFSFGLACAAVPVFLYSPAQFVGYVPTAAPAVGAATLAPSSCPNGQGATCNLGNATLRCCQNPLSCVESSYTMFTCEMDPFVYPVLPRSTYAVGQAFVALLIGFSMMSFVFGEIALAPNGVMDARVSLSVAMSTSLAAFACGLIAFSILQSFVLQNQGMGVPVEGGMLIGSFLGSLISAACSFFTWLPFHYEAAAAAAAASGQGSPESQAALLAVLKREREVEQLRLEICQLREARAKFQRADAPAQRQGAGSHESALGAV